MAKGLIQIQAQQHRGKKFQDQAGGSKEEGSHQSDMQPGYGK